MDQSFRVGDWEVLPELGTITRGASSVRLEPKVIDVLVYLVEHAGEVLHKEKIIPAVWPDTFVTDEVLTNAISSLRKAFGDDPKNPQYIETLPRRGYRLVAEVQQVEAETGAAPYKILRKLGRGGMGEVFFAEYQRLGRKVALKLLAAAAGVAALAIGAWYWLGASDGAVSDTPPAPLKIVPLTSYPGYEYTASFSPDGESVAFDWCRNWLSDCDIYVKQIGVEPPLPLTESSEEEAMPAWSPDGRWIAFLRRLTANKLQVILVPSRGGREKELGEIEWPQFFPRLSWSPDSKLIAASVQTPGTRSCSLWLFPVETGERKRLTEAAADDYWYLDEQPAFSPDGRTLAFSRRSREGTQVYLLSLSPGYKPVGQPRLLPTGTKTSHSPVWTADGREVLFLVPGFGVTGATPDLWRVKAFSSAPAVRVLEQIRSPNVSPRGSRLVYSEQATDPNIWQIHLSSPDRITGSPSLLIESTRLDHSPAWAPNGQKIAFTSTAGGRPEIWVCDADGSNAGPVSTEIGAFPSWSPDSESIVFEALNEGRARVLRVIRADGASPRSLSTGWNEYSNLWPNWSHDGQWIYFRSERDGSSNIWKIPAEGGKVIRVTQDRADVPQESPDGKMLYFQKPEEYPRQCSVWRIPISGGRETQVLDDVHCYGSWAVANSGIYFVRLRDGEERWEIRFSDFKTGLTQVITTFDRLPRMRLALSPSNSNLLFVQNDYAGTDLMLVENFR